MTARKINRNNFLLTLSVRDTDSIVALKDDDDTQKFFLWSNYEEGPVGGGDG